MDEFNSSQKKQKTPKGKIIASAIIGAISTVLFIIYAVMGSGAISLKTGETEGWEALGTAVALIVIAAIMLITLVLTNIFDIVWLISSIKNLVSAVKAKSKSKIFYAITTAISLIILIASWVVLLIFLMAKSS